VIVACHHDSNTSTVTVTDSRSNTWQNDLYNSALGAGNLTAIRSSFLTTGIQAADTITATFGTSTTNMAIVAYKVSGMATSSWLDQTLATADQAATTTPSSGNVTTTQAAELLFGAVGHDTTATTTAGTASRCSTSFWRRSRPGNSRRNTRSSRRRHVCGDVHRVRPARRGHRDVQGCRRHLDGEQSGFEGSISTSTR
jgi:hypothetical protein